MSTQLGIPDDFTGEWNRERFLLLCTALGINSPTKLHRFLEERLGEDAVPSQSTCNRIWRGDTDPVHAGRPHGQRSLVFELADALDKNPLWFLCADKGEANS